MRLFLPDPPVPTEAVLLDAPLAAPPRRPVAHDPGAAPLEEERRMQGTDDDHERVPVRAQAYPE